MRLHKGLATGDVSVEVRGYQGDYGSSNMGAIKEMMFSLTPRKSGFQRNSSEAKQ